ncbi:hypothetical protein FA95DRAFT_1481071 [Auriscalpium vulgare]|uniref:Uncharacterized protein n=1 Tax=Auriscalpium vulgare TaxID=40419 RepID=A0ACB8SD30_9AGAM|nr:hypothetical protein FA95DRAFT_1481071 [Auriscalpium vulgare]
MASPKSKPDPALQRTPSYLHFTPRRAMTSFENLVVLANYEEHLREARKMVWRDRGEPAVDINDVWECLEHGARGGLRAAAIAFTIRSGVNLVLLLARIRRVPRKARISLIQHALFGSDSFRAGAMLGSFVAIYRSILNSLPIVFPVNTPLPARLKELLGIALSSRVPSLPLEPPSESAIADSPSPSRPGSPETLLPETPTAQRTARLSVNAQVHQRMIRKKTRRWHAVVAGATAGGLAILWEKRSRRTTIAQQLFVRGLQGSYNASSEKYGFRVPYGDVILFSLACGQIMYGFLLRQDTLPRAYATWINTAGKIPAESVKMNHDLFRTGTFELSDLETILRRTDVKPINRTELTHLHKLASAATPASLSLTYAPCIATHPSIEKCADVPLDRFVAVFKWMVPIYGALHLIPMLLFKRKSFLQEPMKMLARAGWGTTRSAAFIGVFVIIYQGFFCANQNTHRFLTALRASPKSAFKPPLWLINLCMSRPSFWLGGVLSGLSLLVEAKRRRGELAMYVLPKGLESVWIMARGKGLVFRTGQYGEALLTAIGMGMVMSIYQNDPQHLSGFVRRILYQFIGAN